jgi:hypothetical protein
MDGKWLEKLDPSEEQEVIEAVCAPISKRSLETPAILVLEMHKPIAGVTGNAAVAFAPFIGPVVGVDTMSKFSRLLKDRDAYERLIQRLEELRDAPPEEKTA